VNELREILLPVRTEKINKSVDLPSGSHPIEEMSDFLLKQDYDGYSTYVNQFVKDATHQFHLQHLADNNPETDKDQHSVEDIYGT
jgi:hypothetical protein